MLAYMTVDESWCYGVVGLSLLVLVGLCWRLLIGVGLSPLVLILIGLCRFMYDGIC